MAGPSLEPRRSLRWRYGAWDGTAPPLSFDADEIMAALGEDLLYHGDLDAALRRLLQEGLTNADGQRIPGLKELLERLAARRDELSIGRDLDAPAERARRELEEILDLERAALDAAVTDATRRGDAPGAEDAARRAAEAHLQLDLLPDGLADRFGALSSYDFVSGEARERFEALRDGLRRDLAQMQLDRAAGAMAAATPEERQHLRDGLDALNTMLEQRAAGEDLDPSFESFMDRFGDLFPGGARSLEELVEQLAQRMAAASALLATMTPDQRRELEALAEQLLSDMDLAWQLDRLGANLRDAVPGAGWEAGRVPSGGGGPGSFAEGVDVFERLGRLDSLGQLLGGATSGSQLGEADLPTVAAELGPDAAQALEALAQLTRRLEEAGLVARREGRLQLTPRGLRRLGQHALDQLFARLRRDRVGDHALGVSGVGHDRSGETRAYEYGDPFRLEVQTTIRNAIGRVASSSDAAPGHRGIEVPIRLAPEDFEIEREEQLSSASTVLAIDLSLSMPMRDNFLAAKKVAIALQALIASRYPRDYLGLVGFSATAREIRPEDLPEVSWDFAYGTNLQHALALSRRLLARHSGSKQVIVVTDGEPTAHVLDDGEVYFNYPPVPETLEATLLEVERCTRERIVINTFVLDATGALRSFVEQMTRRNRGRAFFTTPDTLGDYLLVDFLEARGARRAAMRRGA